MKRFIFLLAWSLAAAALGAQTLPAGGVLLDSYAAVVNGKVITVGDVLAILQPVQERLAAQYAGRELEEKLLEEYEAARASLIESQLILLDFEMQGGTLPDRAIEDHVNSVIHDRFANDRTAFLGALAAERLTFAEWRKQMKDQLTVQIMRQKEVSSKILITPFDLQQAYDRQKLSAYSVPERVRLRTLAFAKGDTARERQEALAAAGQLRERLLSGAAAFTNAADGATLQEAGEFLDVDSLNADLRAAVAPLAPDGISEPIEIDGTPYLVQLVERQAAGIRPFDDVAPEIEKELRRAEFDRLNHIWINSLRAKYYIQTFSHNLFN